MATVAEMHQLGFSSKRKLASHEQHHKECDSFSQEGHTCGQGSCGQEFKETRLDAGIQAVLDSIPAYVIIVDDDHRIIMANKIVKDAVGLDSDAINGAFCPKLLHGLTKPFHGCPLEDAKKTGGAVEKEVFEPKMGKWLRSAIYPMSVANMGNRNLYLHMTFDISDEKAVREERAELEKLLTNLLNSTDEGIYGVDSDGKCIFANRATGRLTGYSPEELLGKYVDEMVRFNNSNNLVCSINNELLSKTLKDGEGARASDGIFYKKDGSCLPVEYSSNPIVDGTEVEGAVITFTDISERKRMEDELRRSEKRFRAIVEQSNDGIIMENQTGEVALYNASAEAIFGYTAKEVNEKGLFNLIIPDEKSRTKTLESINDVIKGQIAYIDIPFIKKDETYAWATISGKRLVIGDTHYNLMVVMDITKRKEAEDRANYLAYYDIVTGLPNKTLFLDRLRLSIANANRKGRPSAVIYFTLNNFRQVLDTLGHEVEGTLLNETVKRLSRLVSEEKTLAYFGNGEFAIVMPTIEHAEEPARFSAQIDKGLKPKFHLANNDVHITSSFGISLYPEDGADAQTLLKNADVALSRAREKGNGCFEFFEKSMSIKSTKRLSLEGKLHKAIENEEFVLYYQPQVDIISSRIKGMEALIRWQNPELGMVSPLDFIPVAEDMGLIIPIGEWVLKTACHQAKEWLDKGYQKLRIGVNLSAIQFQHKSLVEDIERILASSRLNPGYLELEITEGVMMHGEKSTLNTLSELKDMGIKIAVDDFGTGYSSLGYLRRYPLDRLKIDKVFIDNLTSNSNDRAIVEAIISVSRALSLDVIAEGVETKEQLATLRSMNCDEIQGYFFSKPLPADEFEKLLKDENRHCA